MSKRYPGNFITGNPVALSQTSNNGIWDLKDQYQAHTNGTWQEVDGVYEIGRSLRFKASASTYLTRTGIAASNAKLATYSFWLKRGNVTTGQWIFTGGGSGAISLIGFNGASDQLSVLNSDTGAEGNITTAVFRDPAAWYHFVIAIDTTQGAPIDRVKIWVNGVLQVAPITAGGLVQNASWNFNTANTLNIGRYPGASYTDGYLAEVNFIGSQALDPSYFGYFDSITNIWQPKKYTGSYGNNGFYLPFTDNSHATQTLGRNFGVGSNYTAYSETCASWQTLNLVSVTSNTHIAPDGNTTADTVTATSASAGIYIYHGDAVSASTPFTASMWFKAGTVSVVTMSEGAVSGAYASFSLTGNGAVTGSGTGATNANITPAGNGWYRCSYTYTTGGAQSTWGFRFEPRSTYGGAGSVGDSVIAWGAQLNFGVTIGPYNASTSSMPSTDWAANNFSITSGGTYDSMVDSPTNVFTSATDIGGVVPGNYCTWNPVGKSSTITLSEASLKTIGNTSDWCAQYATMGAQNGGKWYWEYVCYPNSNSSQGFCKMIGMVPPTAVPANVYIGNAGYGYGLWVPDGSGAQAFQKRYNDSGTTMTGHASGYALTNGDVIQVAYDALNGQIWFGKNNTWFEGNPSAGTGASYTGIDTSVQWLPAINEWYAGTMSNNFTQTNFGQRTFAYTPPTGFKSLNTTNLQALGTSAVGKAAIQANKWFDISLYGGSGTLRNVENSGFQPDMIWIKDRYAAQWHNITDSVRGAGVELFTNATNAEETNGGIASINPNGFTLINWDGANKAADHYVAWQWKQSPTSGLNILTWTGTGNGTPQAISHNLGVTPDMIICKARDAGQYWIVQHKDYAGITYNQYLQGQDSQQNDAQFTAKSSSSITVNGGSANASGVKYVGYVFAGVPGFSKFGTFSGTGASDGPFIYTGFRPRFFMYKAFTHSSDWWLLDATRSSINVAGNYFFPNTAGAEGVEATWIDFTSNGIKLRGRTDPNTNGSDRRYIYMAFAESPFGLNNRAR
jgi:hypothetical protein